MPHRILEDNEVVAGAALVSSLSLSRGDIIEWVSLLIGALLVYYTDGETPVKKRAFYAIASLALGWVFYPGASDILLTFWPAMPESVRPIIGVLAVFAAMPFVTIVRAGLRQAMGDPDAVFGWLADRIPFLRGRDRSE